MSTDEHPPVAFSLGDALRCGALLGATWGVVQWATSTLAGPVPVWPALVALAGDTLLWTLAAGGLFLVQQLWNPARGGRVHGVLLGGVFLAVYFSTVVEPALGNASTAVVWALTLSGLLILVPLLLLATTPRAWRASGSPPPLAWILLALLLAGLFAFERSVVRWWDTESTSRVAATVAAGLAAQGFASVLLLRLRTRPFFALTPALVLLGAYVLTVASWTARPDAGPTVGSSSVGPPVIVISLDTLRPDHLSYFGYERPTSPHLDAFLESAMVYEKAYTASSWTLPSHATAFTGLLPSEHGAHQKLLGEETDLPTRMRSDVETLAERYAERGYLTAAISANRFAVSPEFGLARGFEYLEAWRRLNSQPLPLTLLAALRRVDTIPFVVSLAERNFAAESITDRALDWVAPRADTPFLLFLNYLDAHLPYVSPLTFTVEGDLVRGWFSAPNRKLVASRTQEDQIAAYDGEIAYLDRQLGRLFEGLQDLGIYDRAVILFFSDHGEYLGEHGGMSGHAKTVDEPLLRGPAGRAAPRRSRRRPGRQPRRSLGRRAHDRCSRRGTTVRGPVG